jgi:hypothetical protein
MKTSELVVYGIIGYVIYTKYFAESDWLAYGVDANGNTYYFNSKTNSYQNAAGQAVDKNGDPL